MCRHHFIHSLIAVLALAIARPSEGQTISWNGLTGGSWSNAANWLPMNVPNAPGEIAYFMPGLNVTVYLDLSVALSAVDIQDEAVALHLSGNEITVSSGFTNNGHIIADGSGPAILRAGLHNTDTGLVEIQSGSHFALQDSVGASVITNGGSIVVNADLGSSGATLTLAPGPAPFDTVYLDTGIYPFGDFVLQSGGDVNDAILDAVHPVSNGALHTIRGSGTITPRIINHGTIAADRMGETLQFTNPVANHGLLRAYPGTTMELTRRVDPGGDIDADNGKIEFHQSIIGGTLTSEGPFGAIEKAVGDPFDNSIEAVTIEGTLDVLAGATLGLADGTITNNGTIVVNSDLGSVFTTVTAGTVSLEGTGEIVLQYSTTPGTVELETSGGDTLTQGADHTIRGRGRVSAQLINHGLIRADDGNGDLELTGAIENHAIMEANSMGRLVISATVNQESGGSIAADGGIVRLWGGTITGGTFMSGPTDTMEVVFTPTVSGVTNQAIIGIEGTLQLQNDMTNNGTIVVNRDPSGGSIARLRIDGRLPIGGDGTIEMQTAGNENDATIDAVSGGAADTLLLGAGQTLRGEGHVAVPLQNSGAVLANVASRQLDLTGKVTNYGTLEAMNGGTLRLNTPPTNLSSNVLSGGSWIVREGSILRSISTAVTMNQATILLDGAGSEFYGSAGTTNALAGLATNGTQGSFELGSGRTFTTASDLQNEGAVTVQAGAALDVTGDYLQTGGTTTVNGTLAADTVDVAGGSVSGTGTLQGMVVNGGTFLPGTSPGVLTIDGDYAETSAGNLQIEIGGPLAADNDHIAITGAANLTGTVTLVPTGEYTPDPGTVIEILTAETVAGTYQGLTEPCPWPNRCASLQYTPTSVLVMFEGVLPVVEPADVLPAEIALTVQMPSGEAPKIRLDIPRPAAVRLAVFDVGGRRVATLVDGFLSAGSHELTWSGHSVEGGELSSGVFFVRAVVEESGRQTARSARLVYVR